MTGIVILNYKTPDLVLQCIQSIEQYTVAKYKIYVVDNCSGDSSLRVFHEKLSKNQAVEIIQSSINDGYSAGNNIGIKKAIEDGASEIMIVNSDVTFQNDVISHLLLSLDINSVAIAGPKVLTLNEGQPQYIRRTYNLKYYLFSKKPFCLISRFFNNTDVSYAEDYNNEFKFKGMVSGCCFMIKTEIFKQIGLLDENLFLYCEEWILSKKIEDLGYDVIYNPTAIICHMESKSMPKNLGFQSFYQNISAFYYLKMYTESTRIQLVLVSLYLIGMFSFASLIKPSYRKYFCSFRNAIKGLLNAEKSFSDVRLRVRL